VVVTVIVMMTRSRLTMTGKIMMTDSGCWLIGEKRKNKVVMSPLVVLLTTYEKHYCK